MFSSPATGAPGSSPGPTTLPIQGVATVWGLVAQMVLGAAAGGSEPPRPNIAVFFADNLGWGDVWGAPGTRTPTLDTLANDGLRLLNWYSAAHVCSPSRASLLTGRLMVRTGVYPMTFAANAANGLPKNETTIAEHLKRQGYRSYAVGKWHLGQRPESVTTSSGLNGIRHCSYSL